MPMLISVQLLRALAAWVVVGHHVMQLFFNFEAHNALEDLLVEKGGAGVDVFFVISGLVIFLASADKALTPWRFMLMRVARIAPAYWFYTVLLAVLVTAMPWMFPDVQLELGHVLLSMLFIPAQNPAGYGVYPLLDVGWTLNFEMLFYCLFAVALLVREACRLWVVAALLYLLCYVIGPAFDLADGFYRNDIVLEFLMGVAIGMLYRRGLCRSRPWLGVAGCRRGIGGDLPWRGCPARVGMGSAQRRAGDQLCGAGALLPWFALDKTAGRLLLLGVSASRTGAMRWALGHRAQGNRPLRNDTGVHRCDCAGRMGQLPGVGEGYASQAQTLVWH